MSKEILKAYQPLEIKKLIKGDWGFGLMTTVDVVISNQLKITIESET